LAKRSKPNRHLNTSFNGGFIHSSAYACEPRVDACPYVDTKATGAKKLASITEEIAGTYTGTDVVSVQFYDLIIDDRTGARIRSNAHTGYCFYDKDVAVSALRSALDQAELLGKTYDCYVAIYEGYDAPDLNPLH
jgi:hypothetical protein